MDIADLLILLIVGGISVIGSIAGALKKKKEEAAKPTQTTASSEDSPWDDIFYQEENEDENRTVESLEKYVDEVAVAQEINKLRSMHIEKKRSKISISAQEQTSEIELDKNAGLDNESDDILKDFNLRDAIIYAEILNPKFKE